MANYPVEYDADSKIWRNLSPPNLEYKKFSLGEILLRKLASFEPGHIIEINGDTGIKTIASEMKRLTINFALNLQKLEIKKGDVVVFFASINPHTTPLIYSCFVVGAIVVPLDTRHSDDIVRHLLQLTNPSLIVYDSIYHDKLTGIIDSLKNSSLKHFLSFESQDDGNSIPQKLYKPQNPVDKIEKFQTPNLGNPEETVAVLILTSGTTGMPKLMTHSHAFLGYRVTCGWDVNKFKIAYTPTPLRWISQIMLTVQQVLLECPRVYTTLPSSPQLSSEVIQKHKITHILCVPSYLKILLEYVSTEKINHLDSLEVALMAGERVSSKILDLISRLALKCEILQGYGMTENAGGIAMSYNKDSYKLLDGVECKIIDENGKHLMPNQNGLICIRSNTKFGLYWKNEEANKSAFTNDGWLISGDYGKFDQNNELHVYDRFKDLIRCDGKIVIPNLLETIMDKHSLLDGSYITSIPHPDSSKGEIPIAFCKINESNLNKSKLNLDQVKDDIMEFINLHLPEDQVPPSKIFFKHEYPYTTCGKVDKLTLREIAMTS